MTHDIRRSLRIIEGGLNKKDAKKLNEAIEVNAEATEKEMWHDGEPDESGNDRLVQAEFKVDRKLAETYGRISDAIEPVDEAYPLGPTDDQIFNDGPFSDGNDPRREDSGDCVCGEPGCPECDDEYDGYDDEVERSDGSRPGMYYDDAMRRWVPDDDGLGDDLEEGIFDTVKAKYQAWKDRPKPPKPDYSGWDDDDDDDDDYYERMADKYDDDSNDTGGGGDDTYDDPLADSIQYNNKSVDDLEEGWGDIKAGLGRMWNGTDEELAAADADREGFAAWKARRDAEKAKDWGIDIGLDGEDDCPECNESMITEDLGELEQIDPKILKHLFSTYAKNSSVLAGVPNLGKDSPVEPMNFTTATSALQQLTDPKSNVAGFVIKFNGADGIQVAGFGVDKGNYKKDRYSFFLDTDKLDTLAPNDQSVIDLKTYKVSNRERYAGENSLIVALRRIMGIAKRNGFGTTALLIKNDPVRFAKRTARTAARAGSSYVASLSPKFKDDARRALMNRLEAFKTSRSVSVGTGEEALQYFIDHGYLNIIKIGGFTYKLYDSRIYFDKLLAGNKDAWYPSYIEYQIVEDDKYETLRHQVWTDSKNVSDEEAKSIRDQLPPRGFKIELKLEGANIVPGNITALKRDW